MSVSGKRLGVALLAILAGLLGVALVCLALLGCTDGGATQAQAAYTKWHNFHTDAVTDANGTTMNVEGLAVVGVQVEGMAAGYTNTLTCEGSIDGSTFYTVLLTDVRTGSTTTTVYADGLFVAPVSGLSSLRCPVVWISGTIDVRGDGTTLPR